MRLRHAAQEPAARLDVLGAADRKRFPTRRRVAGGCGVRKLTSSEILTARGGIEAVHLVLRLLEEEVAEIQASAGDLTNPSCNEDRRQSELKELVRRRAATDAAAAIVRALLEQSSQAGFDG